MNVKVGWADEIVAIEVHRRPTECGDVYRVVLNSIARDFMGSVYTSHEEQDVEAIEFFTCLLNDEQRARKEFHIGKE